MGEELSVIYVTSAWASKTFSTPDFFLKATFSLRLNDIKGFSTTTPEEKKVSSYCCRAIFKAQTIPTPTSPSKVSSFNTLII